MKVSVSDSRVDALLRPVADILPAHDVLGLDRQHAAEDLVLLLADRRRLERGRRLHRHEGQDLEQVRHHHVAEGAGRLVEAGALAEPQRLRHVDLDVVDEVAVPDRLEQAVGEAERQDVLRRLLAEEVVDAEDLVLAEDLVQLGVQRHGAREVGAEGLLHDDAAAADEPGLRQQPHRRQRRGWAARSDSARGGSRPPATAPPARPLPSARRRRRRAARSRASRRRRPSRPRRLARARTGRGPSRAISRKPSASRSSSETPMIRQPGMNPALTRWNRPGSSLRRDRSPVAPTSTTTWG